MSVKSLFIPEGDNTMLFRTILNAILLLVTEYFYTLVLLLLSTRSEYFFHLWRKEALRGAPERSTSPVPAETPVHASVLV